MKRNILLLIIGLCCIFCFGCNDSSDAPDAANNDAAVNAEKPAVTNTNNFSESTDELEISNESMSEQSIVEPDIINISMKESGGNSNFQITYNGLKQYEILESKSYTDTPSEDNVYLVLFLSIINYADEDLYFSPESFSATVDDANISHTFMVNDPEDYPSIFNSLPANATTNGYIVWEVPKDWKKLSFHYTGWEDVLDVIIDGTITPDDFRDPVPFEQL